VDTLPETPFFIVGNPRSGTTLLRFILSSHRRLYVPGETGFIPFLPTDGVSQMSLAQVEAVLDRIGQLNRNWRNMVDDTECFYRGLSGRALRHVLDALYRRKILDHDAVRWGDKTPSYVRYIPVLNRIFPTSQFVHVIRDGRDVALSAQQKWGHERWYMDIYYLLKNWVRNVEKGCEDGHRLGPDRYLDICYEDLVQNPADTVKGVCSFLGERFDPALLDHTKLARQQVGPSGHVEVRKPISASSVGRWRSEMKPTDRKLAARVAGKTLARFGYQIPDTEPLLPREWARLIFLITKYRTVHTTRTALTALGLLTLNRGKRR